MGNSDFAPRLEEHMPDDSASNPHGVWAHLKKLEERVTALDARVIEIPEELRLHVSEDHDNRIKALWARLERSHDMLHDSVQKQRRDFSESSTVIRTQISKL